MKIHINHQMPLQHLGSLRRTPSFSNESIHIRPEHRTCVIDAKKWISPGFFELPLPGDRASNRWVLLILSTRKIIFYKLGVKFVLIRANQCHGGNGGSNFIKKSPKSFLVFINSSPVFSSRQFGQMPECSDHSNLGTENRSRVHIHSNRNGQRFKFCVLNGDQIVELQVSHLSFHRL